LTFLSRWGLSTFRELPAKKRSPDGAALLVFQTDSDSLELNTAIEDIEHLFEAQVVVDTSLNFLSESIACATNRCQVKVLVLLDLITFRLLSAVNLEGVQKGMRNESCANGEADGQLGFVVHDYPFTVGSRYTP
jgi:hypothetical protein